MPWIVSSLVISEQAAGVVKHSGSLLQAIIYLASAQLLLGASKQTLLGAAVGAAVGLAFRCNLFGLQRVRVSLSLPATADAGVGQRCVPWYMLAVAKLTRSAAGLYVPPDRCLVTQVPAAVTRFLSHTASRLSLGSHRSPPTLPDGPTIDNAGGSEVRPWVPCYEVTGPVIC